MNKKTRIWKRVKKTGAVILVLILLNQLIYAAIVPVIFFHAAFSEESYKTLSAVTDMQQLQIKDGDSDLFGWSYGKNKDNILLYFGGDSVDCSRWLDIVYGTAGDRFFDPFLLMTVDYPTFGNSKGTISENRFYQTAEALYRYAKAQYPDSNIYVMGYSIGAAAAMWLSSNVQVDGMILVAPMYDGTSIYLPRGTVIHDAFETVATVQMQNDEFAANCNVPSFVIASKTDQMTKLEDIEALCELFPVMPEIAVLDECGHGEYWEKLQTYDLILAYFAKDSAAE